MFWGSFYRRSITFVYLLNFAEVYLVSECLVIFGVRAVRSLVKPIAIVLMMFIKMFRLLFCFLVCRFLGCIKTPYQLKYSWAKWFISFLVHLHIMCLRKGGVTFCWVDSQVLETCILLSDFKWIVSHNPESIHRFLKHSYCSLTSCESYHRYIESIQMWIVSYMFDTIHQNLWLSLNRFMLEMNYINSHSRYFESIQILFDTYHSSSHFPLFLFCLIWSESI